MISEEIQELSSKVFSKLRQGKHYSANDGDIFFKIEKFQHELNEIFKSVGFSLVVDSEGFAYLDGEVDSLMHKKNIQQEAVFFLVLIQWMIEEDMSPTQTIREGSLIPITNLPHLNRAGFSDVMRAVDIVDDSDMRTILNRLSTRGFLIYNSDTLRLLTPSFRFIKFCLTWGSNGEEEE